MKDKIIEAFDYYKEEKENNKPRFFHNETELVFYIAKHLMQNYNIEACFEVPIKNKENKTYKIDLVLIESEKEYLVEFKFVRSKFEYKNDKYEFTLIDGGTTDFYKSIVDIERLEEIRNEYAKYEKAYLVILSNYEKIFSLDNDKINSDKTTLKPMIKTFLNSETTVTTTNDYEFDWKNYAAFNNCKNSEFKYLVLEILPKRTNANEINNK